MAEIKGGQIKCAFCRGTGILPKGGLFLIKCPVCWGKGFACLKKAIKCVYCGGGGRQITNPSLPCQVCKGTGAVAIKRVLKTCPECKGEGRVEGKFLPCLTCQGKGLLEKC